MSDRYDAIRAAHPDLAISLYGLTPGGAVTLEVIAPDGFTAVYHGETAEEAMALAFPLAADDPPAAPEPPVSGSIFD